MRHLGHGLSARPAPQKALGAHSSSMHTREGPLAAPPHAARQQQLVRNAMGSSDCLPDAHGRHHGEAVPAQPSSRAVIDKHATAAAPTREDRWSTAAARASRSRPATAAAATASAHASWHSSMSSSTVAKCCELSMDEIRNFVLLGKGG